MKIRNRSFIAKLTLGVALIGASIALVLHPITQAALAVGLAPNTGGINAVTPTRILDTRSKLGNHYGKLGSNSTMELPVLGKAGVPQAGVAAVMVNVTVLNATYNTGYLTLYPSGVSRPTASNINYEVSNPIANGALVRVGSNGSISIYNYAGTVDVVVDVEGWVGSGTSEAQTKAITPTRILDTRTSNGGRNGKPLAQNETMKLQVLGTHGIPSTGVQAIVANITAVPGNYAGYVTVFPDGTPRPTASTINITTPHVPVANLATIPVGSDGAIDIYSSVNSMHMVIDVQGWITTGNPMNAAGAKAQNAQRILDTRTTLGGHKAPLNQNILDLHVLGVGGVPSTGVAGVILHVTAVNPSATTYFRVFPSGTREPNANPAMVDAQQGTIASNTVVVPVGPSGDVSIHNISGNANAVVDVQGWIAAPTLTVTPPSTSALQAGALTAADSVRAKEILTNANKYAMTTWWNNVAPTLLTNPLTVNAQGDSQDTVRRLSMEAFSLSTAISTGAYDETATGVSTATATARTIQLIHRVASQHVANNAGGWGNSWQSTMWSSYAGKAAWMLWPQLDSTTQMQVARMMSFEADGAAGAAIHYLRAKDGTVLTPGDTGSDDGWSVQAIQVALVMFHNHPHRAVWQNAAARISLASWARPSDTSNGTIVNGASVSSWINGSNVEQDGAVINHARIAPDYSTLIYQNIDGVLLNSLAGQSTPRAAIDLLAPVYQADTVVNYTAPPYDGPGGTIYVPNSATVYYPQGIDWGPGQMLPFALVDAETAAFGIGNTTSSTYEDLHANAELAMQGRFTDGHTYLDSTEYTYVGREEHISQQAAQLYLTKFVRDHGLSSFNDDSYWM